jgi:hypothetical protein
MWGEARKFPIAELPWLPDDAKMLDHGVECELASAWFQK